MTAIFGAAIVKMLLSSYQLSAFSSQPILPTVGGQICVIAGS
jgi:hypothetical protein